MTIRGVGFVGMRSEKFEETVALFRDTIEVPVIRQS